MRRRALALGRVGVRGNECCCWEGREGSVRGGEGEVCVWASSYLVCVARSGAIIDDGVEVFM